MIRALNHGSCVDTPLPILWSPTTDAMLRQQEQDKNYDPNPAGYFQVPPLSELCYDTSTKQFSHLYDGMLMKLSPDNVLMAHPGPDYRIVWMVRDVAEVNASYGRAFAGTYSDADVARAELVRQIADKRMDMTVVTVDYADLITDPLTVFLRLKDAGWPIIPEVCCAVVDPSLYRHRLGTSV
jgi:hypothetical protein